MIYLGIDPGWSGAIAALSERSVVIDIVRFDETPQDISDWLERAGGEDEMEKVCMIEKVGATPQMGVSTAFSFGRAAGLAFGLLLAHKVPHRFVAPGIWQRALDCLSGGDKNVTKKAAQALWPKLKITHATADALLIAEYCRRTWVVS